MSWFTELFINEAKPAREYHSGVLGGSSDGDNKMYILVDEDGNEYPAVFVDEETVFDATANDIREGKVAATDEGVTLGTKEIPSYYVVEGYRAITAGRPFETSSTDHFDFTKIQAIVCPFSKSLANSVAAEKVVIGENVYPVNSTEIVSTVTRDYTNQKINLGFTNDSNSIYVLRYFAYKEEI